MLTVFIYTNTGLWEVFLQTVVTESILQAIRCTVPGCTCECFTPGKLHIRYCEGCSHGWVPHGKFNNISLI